jgi:hypothetical protein
MHAHGELAAGEDGPPDLRLRSLIGTHGVKHNVSEHVFLEIRLRLLGSFLHVNDGAALVGSALGAGAMGQLLLMAAWALGDARSGEKIVGAAECGAAR